MNTKKTKNRYLLFICSVFFFLVSCNTHSNNVILLKAQKGDVEMEARCVSYPEMSFFPILIKVTNLTKNRIVLFFDSLNSSTTNMFFLETPLDTFALGVREKYLTFDKSSEAFFVCEAYFKTGKGSFNSFSEIDSAFATGTIQYKSDGLIPMNIDKKRLLKIADTLVTPTYISCNTATAEIGCSINIETPKSE